MGGREEGKERERWCSAQVKGKNLARSLWVARCKISLTPQVEKEARIKVVIAKKNEFDV